MKRRTLDETIKLDVERLGKGKFDSMMVFSALNDFALSVCAQSIINERHDIKRKDLIEELRNIITGEDLTVQNRKRCSTEKVRI